MGGMGSGRHGRTYAVEDCLRLSVTRLLELRRLCPGDITEGAMRWTRRPSGRVLGIVQIEADMRDPLASRMMLTHAIGGSESTRLVALVATRPHLGGRRWWFVCPITGRRTRFLYLPPHGRIFASRGAHRLGYRVQRESKEDQLLRAAQAIDAKLGGNLNLLAGPPAKPKHMRWPRYWQLRQQREEAILRSLCCGGLSVDVPSVRAAIEEAKREFPALFAERGASS